MRFRSLLAGGRRRVNSCDRQQEVLKSLWRQRSLADRSGMALGVVCGLRKEYTAVGKW